MPGMAVEVKPAWRLRGHGLSAKIYGADLSAELGTIDLSTELGFVYNGTEVGSETSGLCCFRFRIWRSKSVQTLHASFFKSTTTSIQGLKWLAHKI
jgi:hypothetical protein